MSLGWFPATHDAILRTESRQVGSLLYAGRWSGFRFSCYFEEYDGRVTVARLIPDRTQYYSEVRESSSWFPDLFRSVVWFPVQPNAILKKTTVGNGR